MVTNRLPRLRYFHHNVVPSRGSRQPWLRTGSPPGRSTLMTSAPKSARYLVHCGPATTVEQSTTLMSARGPSVKDDDGASDLARLHGVEGLVDLFQLDAGRHQLVQLQPSLQVEVHIPRHVNAEAVGAHV